MKTHSSVGKPGALVRRFTALINAMLHPAATVCNLRVFAVIVERINKETGEANPSLKRIALDACVSHSSAKRAVDVLCASGLLVRRSGSRVKSNEYSLGNAALLPRFTCARKAMNDPRSPATAQLGSNALENVGSAMSLKPIKTNLFKKPTAECFEQNPATRARDLLHAHGVSLTRRRSTERDRFVAANAIDVILQMTSLENARHIVSRHCDEDVTQTADRQTSEEQTSENRVQQS